jgi:hypothetical protein
MHYIPHIVLDVFIGQIINKDCILAQGTNIVESSGRTKQCGQSF